MRLHLARVIRGLAVYLHAAGSPGLPALKPSMRCESSWSPFPPPQELCEGEPELMTEEAILDWASAAADAPANSTAHQCHDRSASLLAWLRSDD